MIRQPLGVRIDKSDNLRELVQQAATLGAKGVVLEASGELHPDRLSESGRREIRHLLRSLELPLIALHIPTRSPYDQLDELEKRIEKADKAFTLAYDLGTKLVLVRTGAVPPADEPERLGVYTTALTELARRVDHRGVRLAIETGFESGSILKAFLDGIDSPALAASIDPGTLLTHAIDPITTTVALGGWVAHAYATDAATGVRASKIVNPRGTGFPPGSLDWEEYFGALEEINYRGFLTAWPQSGGLGIELPRLIQRLRSF
jgi:sugar phosphate isomerase/epimerase